MESITYVYFGTDPNHKIDPNLEFIEMGFPTRVYTDFDTAFFMNIDEVNNSKSCFSFVGGHSYAHFYIHHYIYCVHLCIKKF